MKKITFGQNSVTEPFDEKEAQTVLILAKNKKLPKVTVWLNGSKKTKPKTVLAVAKI